LVRGLILLFAFVAGSACSERPLPGAADSGVDAGAIVLSEGALDPAFGTGGRLSLADVGILGTPVGIAVDDQDRIVVDVAWAQDRMMGLARLLGSGVVDPDFNHGAPTWFQAPSDATVSAAPAHLLVADAGVVGSVSFTRPPVAPDAPVRFSYALGRTTGTGAADSLSEDGGVFYGSEFAFLGGLAWRSDDTLAITGRLGLSGSSVPGPFVDSLDRSGVITSVLLWPGTDLGFAVPVGVHALPGDRLIVVADRDGIVLSFRDGSNLPDPPFDGGEPLRCCAPAAPVATALLGDGHLIVAGNQPNGIVVARFQPDGSLDPGFGAGGVVSLPVRSPGSSIPSRVVGVAEARGTIAVGIDSLGAPSFPVVVRLRADGSLESAEMLDAGTSSGVALTGIALRANDRVLVALPDGSLVQLAAP
jgi:beta-propeller uncharacterized protein DUF5122